MYEKIRLYLSSENEAVKEKGLYRILLILVLNLFIVCSGQTKWENPDSIQASQIDSLHYQLLKISQDSASSKSLIVLELAEALINSGLMFTADSLIDKYLNRNYPSVPITIRVKFLEIKETTDSIRRWINSDDNSQIISNFLKTELNNFQTDPNIIRWIIYNLGQIYFLIEDYAGFNITSKEGLKLADFLTKPDLLLDIAASHFYLDQLDSALIVGFEAVSQLEIMDDTPRLSYAHTQIATAFFQKGNRKSASFHYHKAYELAKASSDFLAIDIASNYLAMYYELIGKAEKAIPILKEVMANKNTRPNFGSPFDTPNHSISQFERAENAVAKLVRQRQRLLLLLILIGSGGIIISLFLRLRAKKREANLLQQINRIQINPHFIFNSLNSLQRFIIENDIGSSNKYLTRFSSLIRSVLNNTQENYIPVIDEIKFLEDYLALEKLRFKNQFSYKVDVNQSVDIYNMMIPTMIVQPFVENSLWHGLVPKDGPGDIQIHWDATDLSCLKCTIVDNGIGRSKAKEIKGSSSRQNSSIGTSLIKNRLDQLSKINKSDYKFEYEDLEDKNGRATGTKVIISIPLKWKKNQK